MRETGVTAGSFCRGAMAKHVMPQVRLIDLRQVHSEPGTFLSEPLRDRDCHYA